MTDHIADASKKVGISEEQLEATYEAVNEEEETT
jgi:hypothetical protein